MKKTFAVLAVAMFAMVVFNSITSKLWSGKPAPAAVVVEVQKQKTETSLPTTSVAAEEVKTPETFEVTGNVTVTVP